MSTPAYSLYHFKDGNPASPAGFRNAKWQKSAPYPDTVTVNGQVVNVNAIDISAYEPNIGGVDARTTTTETIAAAARGKLVTFGNAGATAVTLDSTVSNDFFCAFEVLGAGSCTITPSSGLINGAANLVAATGTGGWLFFDGTNWEAVTGGGGGGSGTVTHTVGALTLNAVVIGNGTGDIKVLAALGNSGDVLTSAGAASPPSFLPPAVASVFGRTGTVVAVAGDYDVAHGGTGQTGSTKGDIVTGSGTNTNARLAVGSNGQVLTADSTQTTGTKWASAPYDVSFNPNVVMGSGAIFDQHVFPRTVVFPGNFTGAVGHCRVNPGSTQTININKNGSQVGTITITSGGVFTFASTGGTSVTYNSGDYMTYTNQAGADTGMLAQWALAGTR